MICGKLQFVSQLLDLVELPASAGDTLGMPGRVPSPVEASLNAQVMDCIGQLHINSFGLQLGHLCLVSVLNSGYLCLVSVLSSLKLRSGI